MQHRCQTGDVLLQDQTICACSKRALQYARPIELSDEQDVCERMQRSNASDGAETIDTRHPQIDRDAVRCERIALSDGILAARTFAHFRGELTHTLPDQAADG